MWYEITEYVGPVELFNLLQCWKKFYVHNYYCT